VAISANGRGWFLVNTSPDLRAQIEDFPPLQPSGDKARQSPIEGVLLTNADLDHVLGLFLLREEARLRLVAPAAVMQTLVDGLRLADVMRASCMIEHYRPAAEGLAPLPGSGGLRFRALPLSSQAPPYAPDVAPGVQSVAYEIIDETTGGRLVIAPDVAAISPELHSAMVAADAVLFDGTFWSGDELQKINGKPRTAHDMGHLVIREGSLPVLRALKAKRRVYFHINNTNPVLDPSSPERAEVDAAGIVVAEDGMEFEL
jgi:pyrroloquinoline quinone biosynthesis protein B